MERGRKGGKKEEGREEQKGVREREKRKMIVVDTAVAAGSNDG